MKKPSFFPVLVGTGFGSGFSPFAPGTAGALLATLIWLGLSFIVSEACLIWLTVAFILFFTILGIWAVNRLEPYWGEDPSRVVVDEMVGVDCSAGCTFGQCLVWIGGFCSFSPV